MTLTKETVLRAIDANNPATVTNIAQWLRVTQRKDFSPGEILLRLFELEEITVIERFDGQYRRAKRTEVPSLLREQAL